MGPQMVATWGQRDTTPEQADKAKHSLYKSTLLLTPDQPALPARYYIYTRVAYCRLPATGSYADDELLLNIAAPWALHKDL